MAKPLKWKKGETAPQYMQRSWASMKRREINRNLGWGGAVRMDGVEQFREGLADFERQLDEVLNEILKGPWGEELLEQVRAELSDHRQSGETMRHLGIWEQHGQVYVGHEKDARWQKHPKHSRANFASIMRWLESGVKRHMIPEKPIPGRVVTINGRVYSQVEHLGHKAFRPMRKSLRVFAAEGERLILDKLGERLEQQMRAAGAYDGGPA